MSISLPSALFRDRRISGSHIRVLAAIVMLGFGDLSNQAIASESGVNDRNCRRYIGDLERYEYITIQRVSGYVSIYRCPAVEGGQKTTGVSISTRGPLSFFTLGIAPPLDVPPPCPPDPLNPPPLNPPKISRSKSSSRSAAASLIDHEFEEKFWPACPRKVGKGGARRSYRTARKKASGEVLLAAMQRFATAKADSEPEFIPHPATWLNHERWADAEPDEAPMRSVPTSPYVWPEDHEPRDASPNPNGAMH